MVRVVPMRMAVTERGKGPPPRVGIIETMPRIAKIIVTPRNKKGPTCIGGYGSGALKPIERSRLPILKSEPSTMTSNCARNKELGDSLVHREANLPIGLSGLVELILPGWPLHTVQLLEQDKESL